MTDLNKILYALSYTRAILSPVAAREKSMSTSDAVRLVHAVNAALDCGIWENTKGEAK